MWCRKWRRWIIMYSQIQLYGCLARQQHLVLAVSTFSQCTKYSPCSYWNRFRCNCRNPNKIATNSRQQPPQTLRARQSQRKSQMDRCHRQGTQPTEVVGRVVCGRPGAYHQNDRQSPKVNSLERTTVLLTTARARRVERHYTEQGACVSGTVAARLGRAQGATRAYLEQYHVLASSSCSRETNVSMHSNKPTLLSSLPLLSASGCTGRTHAGPAPS